MRKFCISFLIISIILLSGIGLNASKPQEQKEYLRIHIRANSNADIDQSVKYEIKDKVVAFLTPYISECDTKQKATAMLNEKLFEIKLVADKVLNEKGCSYSSSASIKNEKFPTRVYADLTLEGGFYDALIIELGEGVGDNWWCVVYPPLCFTNSNGSVQYRSKIIDIINDFMKKEK